MGEVLRVFRAVTRAAPPALTLWFHAYRFPPLPHVPEALRGQAFASVAMAHLGEASDGEHWLAPFREVGGLAVDLMGPVPLGDLARIGGEPTEPAPGLDTSTLLERLDEEVIDRLVEVVGEGSDSPLALVQIRHLGAAFAEAHPDAGAAGHLTEPYQMFALGIPVAPAMVAPIEAALDQVRAAVAPVSSGATTANFLAAGGDVDRCWPPEVRARLRAIKAQVDPIAAIRSNRPVLDTH
jgi:hypothetical protein